MINRLIAVAPMLDWTDRHCRYFLRLVSRKTLLYTEMIAMGAILHGRHERLLAYHPEEHPLAIQLGGSDPSGLAKCAKVAESYGYAEVNLNIGCPSDRVQSGSFGACLMAQPELVAACVAAMRKAVSLPITIKTRIGIDHNDSYEALVRFVQTVADAGCEVFIIHARKAWLKGLSPKENREIPPLRYDVVYQLKRDFPQLKIIINGGITDLTQAQAHLAQVDGVMIGRAFYHDPFAFAATDQLIYATNQSADLQSINRHTILQQYFPYVEQQLAAGVPLTRLIAPVLGLFLGVPGARAWRRHLSEHAHREGAGMEVLTAALREIDYV